MNHLKKVTLAVFAFMFSMALQAQDRNPGSVGIGAQFGQPTGLSVKVYNPNGMSTDILAAWDLNDFFFLNIHGLIENHIGSSGRLHYFVGPGAFAGIRDTGGESLSDQDFEAGISGNFGLNIIFGTIEVFGQVTPRLKLTDGTAGAVGGGAGIRFYLP
ncbi:hypothetical protein [Phaeodactylibacter xiamenensis]|jgi:hypothetical protein|uniref:hypothetical protein n=1 Tax=Phaeodactylibacter xiamenensis TaxID=1524460 RepID=UPI000698CCA3|nr:hypothetical protein [Phaeodactylibacter xiamenensis]MCR9052677.1 hypothetical protein [bacterium]